MFVVPQRIVACAGAFLAASLGLAACNAQKAGWQAGVPGINTPMTVESATLRGSVLEARLAGDGFGIDTFAPAGEPCASVLQPGQEITFLPNTPRGRLRFSELECDASGIGSLRAWRDRRGRSGSLTSDPVPRAQATYAEIYRDDDVIFLRGRFPLASRLAWPGGQDTIAVIPNEEMCQGPAEQGVASMEFRPRGPNPLALVSSGGLCQITGLIQPPANQVDEG